MEFVLPPSLIPHLADWTLIDFSGIQQSPLSGAIRTVSRGQRWQAHVQYHDLQNDDRAILSALMASIRGKSNRVWLEDATYVQRGSFPAPELLSNGSFQQGTAGWLSTASATILGYNRALSLTTTASPAPGVYQSVSLVSGNAYALRACLIDGPVSSPLVLGPYIADPTSWTANMSMARGLITVARVAASSGAANQYPLTMAAGAMIGTIVLCSYASLRRCALVDNPALATFYTSIYVDMLPPSTAGLLRAGDRVEINGELKAVTFDLNSDATGAGVLFFEPALRKLVPDDTPVIIGEPMMRGILVNNAMQVTRPGLFSDFDFTFVEA